MEKVSTLQLEGRQGYFQETDNGMMSSVEQVNFTNEVGEKTIETDKMKDSQERSREITNTE